MFKTIVLALDGSEQSRQAVPLAAELARKDGGRIVIAHVQQDVVGKGGGPIVATEDEIQADIRKQAEELSADGIETSVEMREVMLEGPGDAIVEIAEGANADLIVAGTRATGSLRAVVRRGLRDQRRAPLAWGLPLGAMCALIVGRYTRRSRIR